MTEEQRLAWEKQQGFISFATKSNEVYSHVAGKELSVDELKKEIVQYDNLLSLKSDNNSEFVLEHALESTPKRFLCNSDRIFKIGNTLYKVFEDNIVMCNEKHYATLLLLNETNYTQALNDEIQVMFSNSELKDDDYKIIPDNMFTLPKGKRFLLERRNDNGSNRIRIRVGFDVINNSNSEIKGFDQNGTLWCEARPYKRVLGVWYTTTRTISCSFEIIVDFTRSIEFTNGNGAWERSRTYDYGDIVKKDVLGQTFGIYQVQYSNRILGPNENDFLKEVHFAALKCRASTPDTGEAQLYYNTHLIN